MAKVAMVSALDGTTEAIKTATYKEFAKARAYLPGQKKKKSRTQDHSALGALQIGWENESGRRPLGVQGHGNKSSGPFTSLSFPAVYTFFYVHNRSSNKP